MTQQRVAALQMVSGDNLQHNLDRAARLLEQAAAEGAKLAVLPETFAMFDAARQQSVGEVEAGTAPVIRPLLQALAKENGIWIVGGTIPLADGGVDRVAAASLIIDDNGREVARYDKMHLFDVDVDDAHGSYRESDTYRPGDSVIVVDSPVGRLGVAVCYDLRFPELFRAMLAQQVDVIAVPAAFTLRTGEAHWLALLRARAIETQCYVIGANQGGEHSASRQTSGGSVIIDPWGRVLAEAARGEACIIADIDLEQPAALRRSMPLASHLRFDTVLRQQ